MKLNQSQTKDLFNFTERHYVEYYDVQVEIVDHLASAIEDRLEKNPNQVFEQVLDDVYHNFGPMGLSGFVDSMETKVHARGVRLLKSSLVGWFSIPKIGLTVAIFLLNYRLNLLFDPVQVRPVVLASTLVLILAQLLVFLRRRKAIKQKLLSLKTGYLAIGGGGLISFFNLIYGNSLLTSFPPFPLISSLFLTLIVVFFLAEFSVSRKMFLKMKEDYPEAFS